MSTFFKTVVFLCLFFPFLPEALSQVKMLDKMHFTRLTTVNGLSQSTINTIIKDKTGFMWFGTTDGLNRFDGYKFKIYRNNPRDSSSIPYNLIKTLFVDRSGTLWVGTLGGGLARYDAKSDSFQRFDIGLIQQIFEDRSGRIWVGTFDGIFILDKKSGKAKRAEIYQAKYRVLRNKIITSILEDENNMWIGTTSGLYRMGSGGGKINLFFNPGTDPKAINCEINAIVKDQKNRLWVGTRGGLFVFDKNTGRFSSAQFVSNSGKSNINSTVNTLFCDSGNIIWVGTDDGLGKYHSDQYTYQVLRTDAYDPQSLSRNSVNALFLDHQILWVGTALGGVNKYDKSKAFVNHYKIYNRTNQPGNTNVVTSFAEGSAEQIWIGTDGGGLFSWNPFLNTFTPVRLSNPGVSSPAKSILCLKKSRNGKTLWIGTFHDGLYRLNLTTRELSRYHTGNNVLKNNSVYTLLEDGQANLWVGTNGGGVTVISPEGLAVQQFSSEQSNTLTNNYIRALMEDGQGRIWIGTYGGLNIYDPVLKRFVLPDPAAGELQRHLICAISKDENDKVWIGTQGAGLFIYDPRKRKLTSLTEQEGLSNNNISSITSDRTGYIWISTSRGMNRILSNGKMFENFLSEDGLQTNEFTGGAGYTAENGNLLFGSVEGFDLFQPSKYHKNTVIPPVVITDFQLPATTLSSKKNTAPKFNVTNGEPISLNYDQSVFSIEFAALNYSSSEKNKYACKLEGLENNWQFTGYERKVTYNNLGPGEYVFRVKAANNDGLWNQEGTSLKIIIQPPFWRTTWAYLFYTLSALFVLYAIYSELKTRGKLKNELRFQKLSAEKIAELNQLKMNFFTNISHELRTPLSLIIDPLRKISRDEVTLNQTKSLSELAFRHASRLLTLVNQLLDFRKFESS